MSTIVVAAIILAVVLLFSFLFVYASKIHSKRKLVQSLDRFSKLGSAHNLSFTSQEVLTDKIIGLDGLNRKLLVVEEKDKEFHSYIIDLGKVKTCSVKKSMNNYSNHVSLEFYFKENEKPVSLCFYSSIVSSVYEAEALESKAKDWESMLSKLLIKDSKRA